MAELHVFERRVAGGPAARHSVVDLSPRLPAMPDPDEAVPRTPGVTRLAAILVVAAAAAAVVVAATSGFALIPVVPYASVGALLAIRRPRTSIGWLLLVMA